MRYIWIFLCCAFYAQHIQATNNSFDTLSTSKTEAISSFIKSSSYKSAGFVNIYQQDGKYYMEVPDDKLQRDILVTITILKGSARKERKPGMRFGYGGDSVFDTMIRMLKKGNKIEIVTPQIAYQTDSTYMYSSYFKKDIPSVLLSLPIIATSATSSLIDITEEMNSDSQLFSLRGVTDDLKLGGYRSDQTDIISVQSFPTNVNFQSYRSYQLQDTKSDYPSSRWEISASWLLLPLKPMLPRITDERVGYFAYSLNGIPLNKDQLQVRTPIAAHWRLEPKPEDMERYKRGELVEPAKPIVFYIDRATPSFLVPYLIKAVNKWQPAFEKAGFKNAIHAELAPADSLYSEGDARYSLVSYKASPIPNAYGPMIVDPRSGEIMASHIALYHSVLSLLQRWYFVMCSTVDKRAHEYPLPQDLMGELVATVLTHEVGHTLGLRHNFVGSTAYPTDSLRCAEFIRKNGLGTSIMDYQRYNYIAQPGDKLAPADLLPRIGAYDNFAIEWGYRFLPDDMTIVQQTDSLRRWVDEKRKDRRVLYLEESTLGDPRVQSEDSSDDDVKANTYGMENLKRIMSHLEEWNPKNDSDFFVLRKRYLSVLNQYQNYMGHVLCIIAGHYADKPERDESLIVYKPVPRDKQEAALDFLDKYFFRDQNWLFPKKIVNKTNFVNTDIFEPMAFNMGKIVVKYSALLQEKQLDPNAFSFEEFANKIYSYAFGNVSIQQPLSLYQKAIQKAYVEQLVINTENQVNLSNGVSLVYRSIMSRIKKRAMDASHTVKDELTSIHYKSLYRFITLWENEKNKSLIDNN
ncbi:MAG: DUF5117 domain-containing protein [Bacteroidales bacterium]|nr:DUF5117 domain-containing protein [Bacteroidales bacterium]